MRGVPREFIEASNTGERAPNGVGEAVRFADRRVVEGRLGGVAVDEVDGKTTGFDLCWSD